jgi:hypothetical protein
VRLSDRITILPRQVAASELSIGVLRGIEIREAAFQRSIGVRLRAGGAVAGRPGPARCAGRPL